MKITNRIVALLMAALLVLSFAACGKEPEGITTTTEVYPDMLEREAKINVACYKAGSAISLTHAGATKEDACTITFYGNADEVKSLIKSGKADIAALPLNMAAQLYNETNGGIKIMSVTALDSLYIVEKGDILTSLSDLRGKTILTSGKGTSFDCFLQSILNKASIDPEADLKIEYVDTYDEVITRAKGEKSPDFCLLPCNYACKLMEDVKEFNTVEPVTKILNSIKEMTYAAECLVVRCDYLNAHPDLVEEFLNFAEMSASFITTSAKSGLYLIDAGLFSDEEKALANVFNCNPVCIDGEELITLANENFEFLMSVDPDFIGGEIPTDDIYYIL